MAPSSAHRPRFEDDWVLFYINLNRREDRNDSFLNTLKSVEWLHRKAERISAADGKSLSNERLKQLVHTGFLQRGADNLVDMPNIDLRGGKFSGHLSRGAIGCALSHLEAWERLLQLERNGVKWAMVFEDDVTAIAEDFTQRLKSVISFLPEDWHFCYLGYHGATPNGDPAELLRVTSEVHGTFGYIVSLAGAHRLLHHSLLPLEAQLDSALSRALCGLNAWRVARGAALCCSPPSQERPEDTDCQNVCVCGRCFVEGTVIRCSTSTANRSDKPGRWRNFGSFDSSPEYLVAKPVAQTTSRQNPDWPDFEEFLGVLCRLASSEAEVPLDEELPFELPSTVIQPVGQCHAELVWPLQQLPYRLPSFEHDVPNPLYDYSLRHAESLRRLGDEASVLVHRQTIALMGEYLTLIARCGNAVERRIYARLTPNALVLRLLSCRPLTFWLPQDNYVLKTRQKGDGGFERIGSEDERPPLIFEQLISYDEMALSALMSVAVPTPFFNDGARNNRGRPGVAPTYPFNGVYTAVVGARFEKECCMEHAHMVVTPQQNSCDNGYGADATGRRAEVLRMWARFYGHPYFPDWKEAQRNSGLYVALPGCLFNPEIYKKRMRMSIEPFLLDADSQARKLSSANGSERIRAYVHVVGLGVGAWALEQTVQTDLMLQVYQDLLEECEFNCIGTLDFSWFGDSCNRSLVRHARIRIVFSRRSPADPVGSDDVLVAMYAWDGNAYPGNEYWDSHLDNSGDPAAACCSAIPILQNPDLNPRLRDAGCICVLSVPQSKLADQELLAKDAELQQRDAEILELRRRITELEAAAGPVVDGIRDTEIPVFSSQVEHGKPTWNGDTDDLSSSGYRTTASDLLQPEVSAVSGLKGTEQTGLRGDLSEERGTSPDVIPEPSPSSPGPKPKINLMAEVSRILAAATPAEVLGIAEDADDASLNKAWKRIAFHLHPDKLSNYSEDDRRSAADAFVSLHKAREEFRESAQKSGQVEVPDMPTTSTKPTCTRNVPGQRRWECGWDVPESREKEKPIEKYEVYGPRIFSHEGEPMEWALLATLPRLESVFIFVEESPAQQEVMWAADRIRAPAVPLTVYAVNGRGRSEALYVQLPWANKFPWLTQGFPCMVCRQCCAILPQRSNDKTQCASCGGWVSPSATAIQVRCTKCHGEALWDNAGSRLDCRLCGRNIVTGASRQVPQQRGSSGSAGGTRSASCGGVRTSRAPTPESGWGRR